MLHKPFTIAKIIETLIIRFFFLWVLIGIFAVSFVLRSNDLVLGHYGEHDLYAFDLLAEVPETPVALVFGAGLNRDGTPSGALRDRVLTGVDLYNAGKVQKLLMTGDNGHRFYDEATAMRRLAEAEGVPPEDIVLDYAGFRTYESCYRARDIFGLTSVIAVSQSYHLPRIQYICERMGIDVIGLSADRQFYNAKHVRAWHIRESLARAKAVWQVEITKPLPKFLGNKECVFDCDTSE